MKSILLGAGIVAIIAGIGTLVLGNPIGLLWVIVGVLGVIGSAADSRY